METLGNKCCKGGSYTYKVACQIEAFSAFSSFICEFSKQNQTGTIAALAKRFAALAKPSQKTMTIYIK